MNSLFGSLVFTSPMLLFALAGLPVLWFLLRVMPPRPRVIVLPTLRFLEGLVPARTAPSHTPWWILLLRLLMLALAILALSGPVMNPGSALEGGKTLRIVIDNGWSAAPVWDSQIREAENLLAQAERHNVPALILTTAASGEEPQAPPRPLPAAEARRLLKGLSPKPWNTDYIGLSQNLPPAEGAGYQTVWLSDGLAHRGFEALAGALSASGGVMLFHPPPEALALALNIKHSVSGVEVQIKQPMGSGNLNRPVNVQAMGGDGRILGFQTLSLNESDEAPVFFQMPETLRGNVAQYRLAGLAGAGSVFLLDENFQRRAVGIVAPAEKSERAPLIEASYYLRRALEPYTDLAFAAPEELTKQDRSLIILPDVAAMPLAQLNALESWVHEGGLLLRFAGPAMAANVRGMPLVPVPLRDGGRALDGSLTWDKPLRIKEFSAASPLAGLEIPQDVSIRQQVLADPAESLEGKVWASLEDGTPLITAAPYGKGLLVMVHTSAGADWSDLPLSGLFVDILRRLAALSSAPEIEYDGPEKGVALDPILVLDGFGNFRKPDAAVKPIGVEEPAAGVSAGPDHPPGLYGRAGLQTALNIGTQAMNLKKIGDAPPSVRKAAYGKTYELSLLPYLLAAACALALLDWAVMVAMGLWTQGAARLRRRSAVLAVLICVTVFSFPAQAQEAGKRPGPDDLKYAGALYLAYIKTGEPGVDSISRKGLENLARTLAGRTSAEPEGVAEVDIEKDSLAFFPWIYWPVTQAQASPGAAALQKIQAYLDHGGTVLFDLRYGAGQDSAASASLQKITAGLNIPPLGPIPADHVLTKTFYLLDGFPGLHTTGALWVEKGSAQGRDGVSSVIVGSNDWAAAWAAEGDAGRLPGGARQGEMAMRVGVNITMYALTGNYKTDQVHVPYILERLER